MNLLKNTKCYLSGAMQYSDGRSWRNEITPFLNSLNIKVFDPYNKPLISEIKEDPAAREMLLAKMEEGNFDFVASYMKTIRAEDLRLCDIADFAIVNIKPEVASWGTAEEIVTLCRMKKPTFIVIEGGARKTPLWIMGMFPYKYFYNSLDEVKTVIQAIDSGEKKMDSDRWHLLLPEFR